MRKSIAKNRSELAEVLSRLDGVRVGLSREEARLALKFMETLETALIMRGWKSVCLVIRRRAKLKANRMKRHKKAEAK